MESRIKHSIRLNSLFRKQLKGDFVLLAKVLEVILMVCSVGLKGPEERNLGAKSFLVSVKDTKTGRWKFCSGFIMHYLFTHSTHMVWYIILTASAIISSCVQDK